MDITKFIRGEVTSGGRQAFHEQRGVTKQRIQATMCPGKHLSTWENNSFSVILSFYIRRGCQVNTSVQVQPEITVGSRNMLLFAICRGPSSAGPFLEDVPEADRGSILQQHDTTRARRLIKGFLQV